MRFLMIFVCLFIGTVTYCQSNDAEHLKGRILIKFKSEFSIDKQFKMDENLSDQEIFSLPENLQNIFQANGVFQWNSIVGESSAHTERSNKEPLNIFLVEFDEEVDPLKFCELLSKQEQVVYAEPDYIFTSHCTTNDALIGDQWHLPVVQACDAWNTTKGAGQVVAILDTGVDPSHPDLSGQVLSGFDFINNDSDARDDNMHGTHVAGIVAALNNNSIGVSGVAPEAKILPVKVLQSNGSGSLSTVAMGVEYAATNGATVINMSLGSSAESLVLRDVISQYFGTVTFVASSGNEGLPMIQEGSPSKAQYPAAYPFVIGVESVQQNLSRSPFSNYDPTGPVNYTNEFGYNYEIKAPGSGILSTIPGADYKVLNGTSMASPVVAAAAALLKSHVPNISNEEIFARLIQTSEDGLIQIDEALDGQLAPQLFYQEHTLMDTLSLDPGDGDFRPDTGELIGLSFTIRNAGGVAEDVKVKLRVADFEDPSVVSIITPEIEIGDLGTYGSLNHVTMPLVFRINNNLVHNRNINLTYELSAANTTEIVSGDISIQVSSEEELIGILSDQMDLTPNKSWVVSGSFRVGQNGVLNIPAGTQLRLEKKVLNDGIINGLGVANNKIIIEGPSGIEGSGQMNFNHTIFQNIVMDGENHYQGQQLVFDYCEFVNAFRPISNPNHTDFFEAEYIRVSNSIFENFNVQDNFGYIALAQPIFNFPNQQPGIVEFERNNFDNISGTILMSELTSPPSFDSYFRENNVSRLVGDIWIVGNSFFEYNDMHRIQFERNNLVSGPSEKSYYLFSTDPDANFDMLDVANNYWGTETLDKIDDYIFDFWDEVDRPEANYQIASFNPIAEAHGMVWKVEVNGVDPQESFVEPIGEERVKFDVHFNRPMDTSVAPFLTFGLQAPRTQNTVNADASWNASGTVWTTYYDVDVRTGDGINTIRVADAVDGDGVRIPTEDNLRFQFVIQSVDGNSLSLNAVPQVASVKVEWDEVQSPDILGYNVYRYTLIDAGPPALYSDTVRVNDDLVLDGSFTDFGGDPNVEYFYMITTLNTNFNESDFSSVVSGSPLPGVADADNDGYDASEDCDDSNPNINPGAIDIPDNGIDEDCDGVDASSVVDNDNDGFDNTVDCDDSNPNINPGAIDIPDNGIDEDCDGVDASSVVDNDNDGFDNTVDCDDSNPNINPGATEIPYNGFDDDCNSATLDDDLDEDGFTVDVDCNDSNPNINPGLPEIPYNGFDDDCNMFTLDDDLDQDGYLVTEDCNDSNPSINPGATDIPNNGIDEDCDGVDANMVIDNDNDGFDNTVDCDDSNPNVNPAATEIVYNGFDDDCNPLTLDDDLDQDGFTVDVDCHDGNPNISPGLPEIPYNFIDDDCNPATLDDDLDQDGFNVDVDCNDGNPNISPGLPEIPYNFIDDDCNPATLDDDLDQDGFLNATDCDDMNASINPDAQEIPNNGVDEDCDGMDGTTYLEELSGVEVLIFPNPVSNSLTLEFSKNIHHSVKLYSIDGILVDAFFDATEIDMNEYDSGLYLIEVINLNEGSKGLYRVMKI